MQSTKNQDTTSTRKQKIIQQIQPNKTCRCGACEPRPPKLPNGLRRLKVYYKYANDHQIPVILLQGEWIRKLGFEIEDHIIVAEKQGQLTINLEKR